MVERVTRRLERLVDSASGRRVKSAGVSTPIGGASFELTDPVTNRQLALRDVLEEVFEQRDAPSGVLITVDEIHSASREELADFGNAVQHHVRQDRPIASVVAGLRVVESDELATFFTRCMKPDIASLPKDVVRVGLQQTAAIGGGGFTTAGVDLATSVVAGSPYMMQLVGYWSWKDDTSSRIDPLDIRAALPRCERELVESLRLPRGLTGVEEKYLNAMAIDDGPSQTTDLADRLNQNTQYAGTYRRRLLDKGVIVVAGYGLVDFAIPGHRACLRVANVQRDAQVQYEAPEM